MLCMHGHTGCVYKRVTLYVELKAIQNLRFTGHEKIIIIISIKHYIFGIQNNRQYVIKIMYDVYTEVTKILLFCLGI